MTPGCCYDCVGGEHKGCRLVAPKEAVRLSMCSDCYAEHTSDLGIESALTALVGIRLPGGCDDCNAYQEVDRMDNGIFRLAVHHDDTCPFWRAHQ